MRTILLLSVCLVAQAQQAGSWLDSFSYSRYFSGNKVSVTASAQTTASTCTAIINGGDSRAPTRPFTFTWGDGSSTKGFFPQTHVYADCKRNYTAEVKPDYGSGPEDGVQVRVDFLPKSYAVQSLVDTKLTPVSFPQTVSPLGTRLYAPPSDLLPVQSLFGVPLASAEYALSVAAAMQKDFVNDNVYPRNSAFPQVVYRSSTNTNALYSLWFTDPVAFVIAANLTAVPWSSFLHEMGHNFTLNSPADFYFGGRVDGYGNAIYSETMAQIFQHATVYEMARSYRQLGLSGDLMDEIAYDGLATFAFLATQYDAYVLGGRKFASWNDPQTTKDEAFETFMALAFVFLREAGTGPEGYRMPVKRLMEFLQMWNADWQNSYSRSSNSPAAESFRSTMMVAAVSHGVQKDLRSMFRDLGFPIDATAWDAMTGAALDVQVSAASLTVPGGGGQFSVEVRPAASGASWAARSEQSWVRLESGTARRGSATLSFSVLPNPGSEPRSGRILVGRAVVEIRQEAAPPQASAAGFGNAASYVAGKVSPGEIIVVFGTNFGPAALATMQVVNGLVSTEIGETRVYFDGVAAPMIYSISGQLSCIVPYSTAGKTTTQVQLEYKKLKSSIVNLAVVAAVPGLFTTDQTGGNQGAILNEDWTVNSASNPIARGKIAMLYGTGEGQTTPAGVDGKPATEVYPAPNLRVTAQIGGKEAEVLYAGAAPTLVAGVIQVNVKVPADAPTGNVPVVIKVGGEPSLVSVTIAVK